MERASFDNRSVTFEDHVKHEHNMWHYLYFIVLVKVKDPTEFTGPESYVDAMIKVRSSKAKETLLNNISILLSKSLAQKRFLEL